MIGISPSRKYRAGIGELELSFKKPLRILWWKLVTVSVCAGLRGRAARPERRTGWQLTLQSRGAQNWYPWYPGYQTNC